VEHFYRHYVKNSASHGATLKSSPGAGGQERYELPADGPACATQVWRTFAVMNKLLRILSSQRQPFEEVEMPLVAVLARMEFVGMGFDKAQYCSHNYEVISKLQSLEVTAYELVGKEFSLSSPMEVANALFVDLKIPIPAQARGGKSGRLSSSAVVLEHLARQKAPHPLVAIIGEHRKLNCFLTKYVASLPHKAVYSHRLGMQRIHGTILQVCVCVCVCADLCMVFLCTLPLQTKSHTCTHTDTHHPPDAHLHGPPLGRDPEPAEHQQGDLLRARAPLLRAGGDPKGRAGGPGRGALCAGGGAGKGRRAA
jgi:hypothetical protein